MIWVDVDKAVDVFLDALVKAQVKTQVALFHAQEARKQRDECLFYAEKSRKKGLLFKRDKDKLS